MISHTQQTRHLNRSERRLLGKQKRQQVPRSAHGQWAPAADRPDPLDLLQAQDAGRIQQLLPIKYGRMMASPFAFLRGSAVVMASDLAPTPVTGFESMLCGDAHLANFGLFASPERDLVFDINDFDEAYPGPWEWDLKRLAASAVVAGRENGYASAECDQFVTTISATYRSAMQKFARSRTLDLWYFYVNEKAFRTFFDDYSSKAAIKVIDKMVGKARTKTQQQTLEKLTHFDANGKRQFNHAPPLLTPFRDILSASADIQETLPYSKEDLTNASIKGITNAWQQYLRSLSSDRRFLLQRFQYGDVALRVGGVGSVGTYCAILLLEGGAKDDAIILQQKEAGPSVLASYLKPRHYQQQAERVVIGQRLMQATNDIFLGWHKGDVSGRDFYWRQLKDMKGSLDVATIDKQGFKAYLAVCSLSLARAHARTGDAASISGYLGSSKTFDKALARFSTAYADQTERDFAALLKAIKKGRIHAEPGI